MPRARSGLQTAWGSLFKSLKLERGERILIRGGTTAVGLAAAAMAKHQGAIVAATTRRPERVALLRASGVEQVFIDNGIIAKVVHEVFPRGVDKVLELVGPTPEDSLRCAKPRGIVCITGTVAAQRSAGDFNPGSAIPTGVCLTTYHGTAEDFMQTPLEELAEKVASRELRLQIGKVYKLDQIIDAQRCMEGEAPNFIPVEHVPAIKLCYVSRHGDRQSATIREHSGTEKSAIETTPLSPRS